MIPVILIEAVLGFGALYIIITQLLEIKELREEIVRLRNGNEQINAIKRQLDVAANIKQSISQIK